MAGLLATRKESRRPQKPGTGVCRAGLSAPSLAPRCWRQERSLSQLPIAGVTSFCALPLT